MGGTYSRVKTWIAGEVLTAADLNAEFSNIITYATFGGIDDYSASTAEMQTQTDPYPGSAISVATSGQGELERLRYKIAEIDGNTYWYDNTPVSLTTLNTNYGSMVNRFAYGTIWVPAGAMISTTTNGAQPGTYEYPSSDVMFDYYAFDGTTEEYVSFNETMPENWDLGTVKAKFYWTSATGSTAADTVEWEIRGKALRDNMAIDSGYGTAQVISDALLADNGANLQITAATPAITVGGPPLLNNLVQFKISRNVGGTDNMTEDAWLFGVLIQYTISTNVSAW